MTSRIDTLMNLFGYQDGYIVNGESNLFNEEIWYMDFSNVKTIQQQEIEAFTIYMKEAFNIN